MKETSRVPLDDDTRRTHSKKPLSWKAWLAEPYLTNLCEKVGMFESMGGGGVWSIAVLSRFYRSTRALVMATLALLSNDLGNREEVVLQG